MITKSLSELQGELEVVESRRDEIQTEISNIRRKEFLEESKTKYLNRYFRLDFKFVLSFNKEERVFSCYYHVKDLFMREIKPKVEDACVLIDCFGESNEGLSYLTLSPHPRLFQFRSDEIRRVTEIEYGFKEAVPILEEEYRTALEEFKSHLPK